MDLGRIGSWTAQYLASPWTDVNRKTSAHGESLAVLDGAQRASERHSRVNLEIEYLRAIAVLLVVFVHLGALFPELALGQWTGVDLFFCISGYVISRRYELSFEKGMAEGRWRAVALAFWVRRIFRLTPSAWFWLLINILCAWKFNSQAWFGTIDVSLQTAVYFLTLSTNFALALGKVGSNGYFWSLTLEDQFYFFFPFFLLVVRGDWRWKILLLLIALQALPNRSFTGAFPSLLWVTRLDALMWGCLIYGFSRSAMYWKLEPVILRYRILAFAASTALIFALIEIPKGTFRPLVGYRIEAFVALASAGLVLLASYDRGYCLPLPRSFSAAFKWIGTRSYRIYLIHLPVFGICQEIWLRWSSILVVSDKTYFYAISLPLLTVILAELNFRIIETPLRKLGVRFAKQIMTTRPAITPDHRSGEAERPPPADLCPPGPIVPLH
jgi:peptidoglycan/LPS O-acetylase OafA/YrhL